MFTNTRLVCFLLASLVCSPFVSAQQPAPQAATSAAPLLLDVVVSAKNGPPISGLQQQDLTILDNKVPQPITSFKAIGGRDAEIEIVLVIDAVNTSAQVVGNERIQIDNFLRADAGNLAFPIALDVVTDTGIQNVANFSSDGNSLAAALQNDTVGLRELGRAAGYWGATERLQISLKALGQIVAAEGPRPGRKLILWVSPGWPLLFDSTTGLDSKQQQQLFASIVGIASDFLRGRMTLYSIDPLGAGEDTIRTSDYEQFLKGVSKPSQTQVGDLGLQVIAVQSGGFVLNSGNDIDKFLEECVADSAPYYEISFTPTSPEHPNEYHHLEVKVDKPGLTARTRQSYYAQPSAAPAN